MTHEAKTPQGETFKNSIFNTKYPVVQSRGNASNTVPPNAVPPNNIRTRGNSDRPAVAFPQVDLQRNAKSMVS